MNTGKADLCHRREFITSTIAGVTLASSTIVSSKKLSGKEKIQPANAVRFPIWDSHCHLSSVVGETPKEKITHFLKIADVMNIEKVVIFMGWPFVQNPTPEILTKQNNQVLAAMKVKPERVSGYVYVNPNYVDASLNEMDRCFAEGNMVGVKLWVASRCDESSLAPIIRRAEKYNAVIFQHTWIKTTGNLKGESTPMQLALLAEKFPETKFICGHAGGVWEMGIRAIQPYSNIFMETSGCAPTVGLVEMAVRELGAERVIFGSDAAGRSFASQISKVSGAAITDQEKKLIFKDNYQKLLSTK